MVIKISVVLRTREDVDGGEAASRHRGQVLLQESDDAALDKLAQCAVTRMVLAPEEANEPGIRDKHRAAVLFRSIFDTG